MTFKFDLDDRAIAIIGEALGARPYKEVASTISDLQRQLSSQMSTSIPVQMDPEKSEINKDS